MHGASDTQRVSDVLGRLSFACPTQSCKRREAVPLCSPQTFTLLPRVPGIPLNSAARALGLQYESIAVRTSAKKPPGLATGVGPQKICSRPQPPFEVSQALGQSTALPAALLSYLRSCSQQRCVPCEHRREVPCVGGRRYLEPTGLASNEFGFNSRLQTTVVSTRLSEQASGKQRGSLAPGLPGRLLLICLGQASASVHPSPLAALGPPWSRV